MRNSRKCQWLAALCSACLVGGTAATAQAQLAISIDGDGVRVQDGTGQPLVVGPGQSFAGTLTNQGFQGVTVGSPRPMRARMVNPFRDGKAAKGYKIQAGGISVALPYMPDAVAIADPQLTRKIMMLREMARTTLPETMLSRIDEPLAMYPQHPDLLQLKAVMLMRTNRYREAAACAYDVMAANAQWDWTMLRGCYADQDAVVESYRQLRHEAQDRPTLEAYVLMAWWERMLDHPTEAMQAVRKALTLRPEEPLLMQLLTELQTIDPKDVPPAVEP